MNYTTAGHFFRFADGRGAACEYLETRRARARAPKAAASGIMPAAPQALPRARRGEAEQDNPRSGEGSGPRAAPGRLTME
jgi:hypothetical protein